MNTYSYYEEIARLIKSKNHAVDINGIIQTK